MFKKKKYFQIDQADWSCKKRVSLLRSPKFFLEFAQKFKKWMPLWCIETVSRLESLFDVLLSYSRLTSWLVWSHTTNK